MNSMHAPRAMPPVQATVRTSDAHEPWLAVTPAPAYVCDQDGRVLHWNERAIALWGAAPDPGNDAELYLGPATQVTADGRPLPLLECLIAQSMRERLGFSNHPVRLRLNSGRIESFDAHVRPTSDGRGQTTGAICVLAPPTRDYAADRAFLTALDTAERVLAKQMTTLAEIGRAAATANAALASVEMSSNLKTAASRMHVLQVMLDEAASRQNSLAEGVLELNRRPQGGDDAIGAFVGAAHRIRTSLDLILGSGEEIAEIAAAAGEDSEVLLAAREINLAARWVLQYTSELQDIAQFEQLVRQTKVAAFDPNAITEAVAARLSSLAPQGRKAVSKVSFPDAPATADGDARLVEKCLHYVALTALNNAAGKGIEISLRRGELNGRGCVLYVIEDQGSGASLELRAESTLSGSSAQAQANPADGAGYAVSRCLVRCLGGTIELTNTKGKGTTAELKIPLEAPP
jgi:signal transduction histidine kinase